MSQAVSNLAFEALDLPSPLLQSLQELGYETPSPIQQACIPILREGHDLIGQAQTGTGKTAAFALPLLSRINTDSKATQVLVLTPTRELAIQVAEACQRYARHVKNFRVQPIYGGQNYSNQLQQLKRGVHLVVGTPGRVMDHMRRGSLKLNELSTLVLDEADEMLRMGFIDDVEWVLEQTPEACQVALFSATMPKAIRQVAQRYLSDAKEIKIAAKTSTANTIRQRVLHVAANQKLDALTRILEAEKYDGIITFVRTKTATTELADKLRARGYSTEALNGDIAQNRREIIVKKLKSGKLDILVATDVAARGLDVDRISHVINYDIPQDTEAYVHRIGRTGRAGRTGDAILFATQRETHLLKTIEKVTRQPIEKMALPGAEQINASRIAKFKQQIIETIANHTLTDYQEIIHQLQQEQQLDALTIAAALAHQFQGEQGLLIKDSPREKETRRNKQREANRDKKPAQHSKTVSAKAKPLKQHPDIKMNRYRIAVGKQHQVKPGQIVGAIANQAEIESQYIGHIEIFEDFSTVDLPDGMPKETFQTLRRTYVCQQKLDLQLMASQNKKRKNRERAPKEKQVSK